MRRLLVPFLLALAACSGESLTNARGELLVRPERIDFADTYVGFTREVALELENTGRSDERIELAVEAPFALGSGAVLVAGGETVRVPVTFAPVEETESAGEVVLSTGVRIPLRGRSLAVPECPPSDRCVTISFDPDGGGCVEVRAENGSDCSDACFEGVCMDGECRGEARSCDDENVCTADACDPASGCVHYDEAAACPDSADPCRAPVCDRVEGCTFAEAVDGVACGPANCTTSFVCLAGTCTEVHTPEGGDCGESSPCLEQGKCVEGVCVQDPPVPLEPTWSRVAAPGAALHFDGTMDVLGNVYWSECTFESCDLVSVTARGQPRYRKPLFVEDVGRAPTGGVALAGDLVLSTLAPNRLEAFDTARGDPAWSRNLLEAVAPQDAAAARAWVDEAAPPVVADEVVLVALEGFRLDEAGELEAWGGWVVAVRRTDGSVAWVQEVAGRFTGFVGDEAGSVTFGLRLHDAAPTDGGFLVSLGTTGAERWRKATPFQPPLATLGGLLLQATGELRDTEAGGRHEQLPLLVPTYPQRSPLFSGRHLYVMGVPLEPCDAGSCPTWVPHLFRFEPASGEEAWRQELTSSQTSEPVLTSDFTVLFAQPAAGGAGPRRTWLTELTPERETVFTCALPEGGRFDGPAGLHLGSWVTVDTANRAVVAFDLQERVHPAAGWVVSGGTPQRGNRPR